MKLCGSESVLTIGGAIILVLFLIVCIFGIVNDGKHSCSNGIFVNDITNKKASADFLKCASEAEGSGSLGAKEENVNKCLNKKNNYDCIEGAGSMVFLIICIVLIVLVFGLLMWCTFGKNRVGGGGPGGLY